MLVKSGVVRLTAPNPSLMTGTGTNTYIVGHGDVVVIDPGPDDDRHIDAIEHAMLDAGGQLVLILVTHSHVDHLPGAFTLQRRAGVPIAAFHQRLGIDVALRHGQHVPVGGISLQALHTPGHASDHLCFYEERSAELYSGDLIAGEGTVVIGRDGELEDYLASLRGLLSLDLRRIYPGHGPVIDQPRERIEEYIAHRHARERALVQALTTGPLTTMQLVRAVYTEVDERLYAVAAQTVEAHLRKLIRDGTVRAEAAGTGTVYSLTGSPA